MAESVACNFINTPVYEAIASWIETASLPIVLLAAKGVGKTTTLIMLHESCKRPKHYFDLSSDHDVVRLSEKLKTISPLSGNEEKEYPVWLFVDNIHEMVNYTCLNDRMYVKGWTQYRNRGRLVCAVSRYGLVGLLKKFRINYSDLNTQVVNPTEEVAWSLLRRSNNEMISDPANEPKIREFLEYVGFVPRLVESLIQECRVQKRKGEDIEAIIARVTRSTIKNLHYVLNEDVQSLSPGSRYAHICALALCVSRGLRPAELPTLVDKINVSWTCLKETSDEVLTSVSPLAAHVVNQHLSTDVSLRDETVELLKQVNLKGESNVRGYIFETLIFSNFTSASARLTLLGMTKDRKEVNLTTLSQAGVVLNQKQFTSTFEPEKNICYATPNMKGVDFILSLEREVYFIQCTVNKAFMTAKASFWQTCPSEWTPVLITVFDVEDTMRSLLASNGTLSNEFKNGKFYIGDAKTLLTEHEIKLCSPA